MASSAPSVPVQQECPVCHDEFDDPKILPCTHLVCRKCVLCLRKKKGSTDCPLCRHPIFPSAPRVQGDLSALVDDLPTDLVSMAIIEGRKILKGDDVCVCDMGTKAMTFCFQCGVKLCPSCSKVHNKIASTRDHQQEQLSSLTLEHLAASYHVTCQCHPDRQAELFCTCHQELICILCSSTTHRQCTDVKGVSQVAGLKRKELKAQVKRLKIQENRLQKKINLMDMNMADARAKFKVMRDDVKTAFDDLQQAVENQRQQLNTVIETQENDYLKTKTRAKRSMERHKSTTAAYSSAVQRLSAAADNPFLAMLTKLRSRLDDLEALYGDVVQDGSGDVDVTFHPGSPTLLKDLVAVFGHMEIRQRRASKEVVCPSCDQPGSEGDMCQFCCPPFRKRDACRECYRSVLSLENGDMYTCSLCGEVHLACDHCGWLVKLRDKDGRSCDLQSCPKCGQP